jgi:hypothetical protein
MHLLAGTYNSFPVNLMQKFTFWPILKDESGKTKLVTALTTVVHNVTSELDVSGWIYSAEKAVKD